MKASLFSTLKRFKFASIKVIALLSVLTMLPLLVQAQEDRPKVLLMIAEQQIGQEALIYWWNVYGQVANNVAGSATTIAGQSKVLAQQTHLSVADTLLKEELMNYNIDVVDASAAAKSISVSPAYKVADISKAAALQMGKDVNADIVIKGKVLAKTTGSVSGSNVITYNANISATALRISDGRVIAAGRASGVARHISPEVGGARAIESATLKLAEKLGKKIDEKWPN